MLHQLRRRQVQSLQPSILLLQTLRLARKRPPLLSQLLVCPKLRRQSRSLHRASRRPTTLPPRRSKAA